MSKRDSSKGAAIGGLKVKFTERGDRKGIHKDKATVNRLKMYNGGAPKRNRDGKIISQAFKSKDTSHEARIEPNRKWFGPGMPSPHNDLSFSPSGDRTERLVGRFDCLVLTI